LALGNGIREKIDVLDTDKAIKAIVDACGDSESGKVIISDNFLDKNEKETKVN